MIRIARRLAYRLLPLLALASCGCHPPMQTLWFEHGVEATALKRYDASYYNVRVGVDSSVCILLPDGTLLPLNQLTFERVDSMRRDGNLPAGTSAFPRKEENDCQYWTISAAGRAAGGYEVMFEHGQLKTFYAEWMGSRSSRNDAEWAPGFAGSPTHTAHRLPMSQGELMDVFGPVTAHDEDWWPF
jgi:hypothetical protein